MSSPRDRDGFEQRPDEGSGWREPGHLGGDVVTRLRVVGPTAPNWKKGPRTVRGRGPRDTYG